MWVNGWESAVCGSQGLAGGVLWIVTGEVNAFVIYCGIMQEDLPCIRQGFLRSPHHFRVHNCAFENPKSRKFRRLKMLNFIDLGCLPFTQTTQMEIFGINTK